VRRGSRHNFAKAVLVAIALASPQSVRASDVQFRGLLDVVAAERDSAHNLNLLTRGDSSFDPYGLRLFVDAQVVDQVQAYGQVVLRDATTPYVYGAYLLYTPFPGRDAHVLAGKIPWPIGTYGPRTYSNKNPLIGTPLLYQYHTTLVWYELVPSADALLATAGLGQYGINYYGFTEGPGMPVVDDSYWDVGVSVVGSERPLEYALGVTAGTPGWGSTSKDENSGKTVLGRIGLTPLTGLRLGVSGAYGPYLIQDLDPSLPEGTDANDYQQVLGMVDLEVLVGHAELRAEGAWNTWETPTVGDLDVTTGYVELKYSLPFGAFVAGRLDAMRFGEIADSTGAMHTWDLDVTRYEIGAGYRFTSSVLGKVVYQSTALTEHSGADQDHSMVAGQVSIGF
jgi:hypothetical protein